jgi:hypothetical protein
MTKPALDWWPGPRLRIHRFPQQLDAVPDGQNNLLFTLRFEINYNPSRAISTRAKPTGSNLERRPHSRATVPGVCSHTWGHRRRKEFDMPTKAVRGSELVMQRLSQRGEFPMASAKLIGALADHPEVKFQKGFPIGIPDDFVHGFKGTLQVTPKGANAVLTALLKANVNFEVFPIGIINPEAFRVNFSIER